jgi:Outer membrane lipoprotein-sorting protein
MMRLTTVIALTLGVTLMLATACPAHAIDALSIVKKTKAALEPNRSSTATITVHVYQGSKELARWTGVQTRGSVDGSKYMLTAFLAPPQAHGMAMLSSESDGLRPAMWLYMPLTHRVQRLKPVALSAPFFGTDFTYADLGFMNMRPRYKYLGAAKRDGVETYEIEAFPDPERYDSASFIAWINQQTFLPVERDFFNYDRHPWRIERYSEVKDIQGVPTVGRLEMVDKTANDRTEFDFGHVKYDVQTPEGLFDPAELGQVSAHSFWKTAAGHEASAARLDLAVRRHRSTHVLRTASKRG